MFRRRWKICVALSFFLILGGCAGSGHVTVKDQDTEVSKESSSAAKNQKIYVYVCGQVKNPGVYEFTSDDRIVMAVEAAGGFTSKAAKDTINQAEKMKDGQQIYVPSKQESKAEPSSGTGGSASAKVNINTAGKEELMTLSGIGESKASDIIAYRQEQGSFSKIEDIMKIQGIKEGVFNKIKDNITI